jgi:NAD(P)-dependent dehydrogenase (short-subunit alcohol dehydrogenase family)
VLLDKKNAIVYGAAGSMGAIVARAFAREGAGVFLAGRTLAKLDKVASEIRGDGGLAQTAELDVMDKAAVEAHAAQVVNTAGSIDISFNAISFRAVQGIPLIDMAESDFMAPIIDAGQSHFITATTAARAMIKQGSGVIIMLSATAAMETRHQMGGFSLACAGIEALTRTLAGEVGRKGVRVVGIRSNFTPEANGATNDDVPFLVKDTLLGRLPQLSEIGGTAVYLASDAAGAMSGATVNLSCGAIV